jgi:ankyrin repeat protein
MTVKTPNELLASAINKRDIEEVRMRLRDGADPNALAGVDTHQNTTRMLAYAVRADKFSLELCRLLLKHGASLEVSDPAEPHPLFIAATQGNAEVCQEFIARGAQVDRPNKFGNTALHGSVINGSAEVCRLLLDNGADLNHEDHKGRIALHFLDLAALMGGTDASLEICQLLLLKGESSSYTPEDPDGDYMTPFQKAVEKAPSEVVNYLLQNCGEDPSQRTLAGTTMLELATKADVKEVLHVALTEHAISAGVDNSSPASESGARRARAFTPI